MIIATATGHIGKDAVERQVGDQTVINFSIASNEKIKDEQVVTWLDISYWRKSGVLPYLKKGTRVAVSGKLGTRVHEGKTYLTLRADHVELLGDGQAKEKSGGRDNYEHDRREHRSDPSPGGRDDDEIPF